MIRVLARTWEGGACLVWVLQWVCVDSAEAQGWAQVLQGAHFWVVGVHVVFKACI